MGSRVNDETRVDSRAHDDTVWGCVLMIKDLGALEQIMK